MLNWAYSQIMIIFCFMIGMAKPDQTGLFWIAAAIFYFGGQIARIHAK